MQTWLVHMRQPAALRRDLGLIPFVVFQLIVGGNVFAALIHPVFVATFVYAIATGTPLFGAGGPAIAFTAGLFGTTVAIGYLTSAALGCVGLMRRGAGTTSWVLLFTPVYWLLLSAAAWRALYQLIREPYRWEKTEHGLARTSRRRARAVFSLTKLERHLSRVLASQQAHAGGAPQPAVRRQR